MVEHLVKDHGDTGASSSSVWPEGVGPGTAPPTPHVKAGSQGGIASLGSIPASPDPQEGVSYSFLFYQTVTTAFPGWPKNWSKATISTAFYPYHSKHFTQKFSENKRLLKKKKSFSERGCILKHTFHLNLFCVYVSLIIMTRLSTVPSLMALKTSCCSQMKQQQQKKTNTKYKHIFQTVNEGSLYQKKTKTASLLKIISNTCQLFSCQIGWLHWFWLFK